MGLAEDECSLHCEEGSDTLAYERDTCSTCTAFTPGVGPTLPVSSLWRVPWTPTGQKPSRSASLAAEEDAEYDKQLHEQEHAAWAAVNQHANASMMCAYDASAPSVLASSPGLRAHAVDWLVDVAWQLALSNDTLHLAVQLLDRYLAAAAAARTTAGCTAPAADAMPPERLWLLGAVCLWAAAKYEECAAPRAAAFLALIAPTGYPAVACKADLLRAEVALLRAVGHRLSLPTAKTFLRRTLSRVPVDRALYFMAGYLCELSLLEAGCLSLLPSQVAAASCAWAMVLLRRKVDNASMLQLTGYSLQQLASPLRISLELHALVHSAPRDCAIRVKYSSPDLECVALLPPPPLPPPAAAAASDGAGCMGLQQQQEPAGAQGSMLPAASGGMEEMLAQHEQYHHEQQQQVLLQQWGKDTHDPPVRSAASLASWC